MVVRKSGHRKITEVISARNWGHPSIGHWRIGKAMGRAEAGSRRVGLLRPRMGLVVYGQHVLYGELGVTLGRRKALMAEHLLDRAEVGAFFEHVRAEGVPEGVRMNVG